MTIKKNKKADMAVENLLSRSNYLVTQGNDLAKSLGNLTAFEHKVLDYCFSLVKKDSKAFEEYYVSISDLLKYLGINASGFNYERVVKAFKRLNDNTAIYAPTKNPITGTPGVLMFQLFDSIGIYGDGMIRFSFSSHAEPYVFDLVNNYYSLKLGELASVSSKYGLILLKLWRSNQMGNSKVTIITGNLSEWENWFLGGSVANTETPGRFKQRCLVRAMENLNKVYYDNVDFDLKTKYSHRKTVGFEMIITDNR